MSKRVGKTGSKPRKNKRPGWLKARRSKAAAASKQASAPRPVDSAAILERMNAGDSRNGETEAMLAGDGILRTAHSLIDGFLVIADAAPHKIANLYNGPVKGSGAIAREKASVAALKAIVRDLNRARKAVRARRFEEAYSLYDTALSRVVHFEPTMVPQGMMVRLAGAQARLMQAQQSNLPQMIDLSVDAHAIASDVSRDVMESNVRRAITDPGESDSYAELYRGLAQTSLGLSLDARSGIAARMGQGNDSAAVVAELERALGERFGSLEYESRSYADEEGFLKNFVIGDLADLMISRRDPTWSTAWQSATAETTTIIANNMLLESIEDLVDVQPYRARMDAGEMNKREVVQLVRGVLTRAYSSEVAAGVLRRVNQIFLKSATLALYISRSIADPPEARVPYLRHGLSVTRTMRFGDGKDLARQVHAFLKTGMGGELYDAWRPLPIREPADNAMQIPRDRTGYFPNTIISALNGLAYSYSNLPEQSGIRQELSGVHGAVLGALNVRGELAENAADSLRVARVRLKEARRKIRSKANGNAEALTAAADRAETLVNDIETAPSPKVARRVAQRLPQALPTLAQSVLFHSPYRSNRVVWALSRNLEDTRSMDAFDGLHRTDDLQAALSVHGLEGMATDGFFNLSSELLDWESVDGLIVRHGLSHRPEGRFLRNYMLSCAKDMLGSLQGYDFPPHIMDSNGLSAFMLLRRSIAWASRYELPDIPFQELTHEHLYETLFRGMELGLDPLELWEVAYAMPAAYLNNEMSVNARKIDAFINQLRTRTGPKTYAELVTRAGALNDTLQKIIFQARHGMAHVERGNVDEGFSLYRQAVVQLNVYRRQGPDVPTALLDRLQQRLGGLYGSVGSNGSGVDEAWPIVPASELQEHRQRAVSQGWLSPSLAGISAQTFSTPRPIGR